MDKLYSSEQYSSESSRLMGKQGVAIFLFIFIKVINLLLLSFIVASNTYRQRKKVDNENHMLVAYNFVF